MFETIEEARAEIIRLQEALTTTETERDSLSRNNESLTAELERVRTLNTTYFEKLSAQYAGQEDKKDDEKKEVLSCEAYANTLKI